MRLAGGGGDKENGRWMGHDEPLKRVYCYTPLIVARSCATVKGVVSWYMVLTFLLPILTNVRMGACGA